MSPIKSRPGVTFSQDPDVMISAEHVKDTGAGSDSGYGVSPELSSTPIIAENIPSESRAEPRRSLSQPEVPRLNTLLDTSTIPQLPPIEGLKLSSSQIQDWSMSGEIYRKKIEALRNEVGNGWLSVLSEEGWEPQKSPANTIRPNVTSPRANGQQAIHSGRTLG
jgi:hypothetical protein